MCVCVSRTCDALVEGTTRTRNHCHTPILLRTHCNAVNRRMDEWVTQDQLDLSTVEVEIPENDPKK